MLGLFAVDKDIFRILCYASGVVWGLSGGFVKTKLIGALSSRDRANAVHLELLTQNDVLMNPMICHLLLEHFYEAKSSRIEIMGLQKMTWWAFSPTSRSQKEKLIGRHK